MGNRIILGLLQNTAFLLVFSILYNFVGDGKFLYRSIFGKLASGLIVGLLGIILMLTPWILYPGIVFDTRSILLSISGLFLGLIPTLTAMLVTALYRFYMGGAGVWMGVSVIFMSGLIGILWGTYRKNWQGRKYRIELLVMGLLVHLLMVFSTVLLPAGQALETFKVITIPVMVIYPIATMLMGTLLVRQDRDRENRQAKEKLYASEYRFSEMLRSVTLFSVMLDCTGNILFCNRYLLESTGYSMEELCGKNWFDMMVPEDKREKSRQIFMNLLQTDRSYLSFENETLTKNGDILLVNWRNAVVRDMDGSITSLASIGENITERRQTENRLKAQRAELDQQYIKLSRLNEELVQAKEKAEESDRLKTKFLANMSHEIRTPMNAIMGFSGLLKNSEIPESDRLLYIRYIEDASDRLMKVISDILDLSRIESNQLKIVYRYGDLFTVLRQSIAIARTSPNFKDKENLRLVLDIPEDRNCIVETDLIRYQQVVDNLLNNALKYTSEGEVRITCNETGKGAERYFETIISDTGQGIPMEKQNLVFERFRQLNDEVYREGAGLGLSICKGIVDLLGGRISFVSEVHKGTTFRFTIPVRVSIPADEEGSDKDRLAVDI